MQKIIDFFESHMQACQIKTVTGFDCPGCGTQRSFILLLKGNFLESFYLYPALIPFITTIGLLIWQLIAQKKNGAIYIKYSFILSATLVISNFIFKLMTI